MLYLQCCECTVSNVVGCNKCCIYIAEMCILKNIPQTNKDINSWQLKHWATKVRIISSDSVCDSWHKFLLIRFPFIYCLYVSFNKLDISFHVQMWYLILSYFLLKTTKFSWNVGKGWTYFFQTSFVSNLPWNKSENWILLCS